MAATLYRSNIQERGYVRMEIWGDTVEEIQAVFADYCVQFPPQGYNTVMSTPQPEARAGGKLVGHVSRWTSCS